MLKSRPIKLQYIKKRKKLKKSQFLFIKKIFFFFKKTYWAAIILPLPNFLPIIEPLFIDFIKFKNVSTKKIAYLKINNRVFSVVSFYKKMKTPLLELFINFIKKRIIMRFEYPLIIF